MQANKFILVLLWTCKNILKIAIKKYPRGYFLKVYLSCCFQKDKIAVYIGLIFVIDVLSKYPDTILRLF